jgi:dTMP kinase
MSRPRGRFITIEGIEGSGKSTQGRLLVEALQARGYPVLATLEPGGTPLGRLVRAALLDPAHGGMEPRAELLLYCADRAEHVARVIQPALEAGTHVVCDRFSDATRAYQGFGRGLGLDLVERVNLGDLTPDLTLLLDLEPRAGLERARRRNRDRSLAHESRFEEEELRFHERVRQGYLEVAKSSGGRTRVIDADRPAEAIAAEALALAADLLGPAPAGRGA